MLRKSLGILSGLALLSGLGAVFSAPSYADGGVRFTCDTESLATVATNAAGRSMTVMRWKTAQFSGAGYDPLTRCQQVSGRFNDRYQKNNLDYITAGVVRGMPVICAPTGSGTCDESNILFTLNKKNSRNAAQVLQTIFDARAGAAGAVVNESTDRTYISMKKLLAPLETESGSGTQSPQPSAKPSSGW
jgi:hypothetical protein